MRFTTHGRHSYVLKSHFAEGHKYRLVLGQFIVILHNISVKLFAKKSLILQNNSFLALFYHNAINTYKWLNLISQSPDSQMISGLNPRG